MAWTKKQQEVIDSREKNLLVSAAAGSGKTAVMVARIIEVISDEKHPIDVDHLLVVTFTNAAASEMKERIMNALEQKVEKEPNNSHLLRQLARVQKAQITTIHSFCLNLIREHFMEVDLDPGFRIGEEGEMALLEQEAMEQLLEEAYEEKAEDFLALVESYAPGKSDAPLESMILKLYTFARAGSRPVAWLEKAKEMFHYDKEELLKQDWASYMTQYVDFYGNEALAIYDQLKQLSMDPKIPDGHRNAVCEEWEKAQAFRNAKTLEDYILAAKNWEKTAIRGRAKKEHDKEKVSFLMERRKKAHEIIEQMTNGYLIDDWDRIVKNMHRCQKPVDALVRLVIRYMELMKEKKKEKNVLDFTDLEQYALQILTEGYAEDGTPLPSKTAMEQKKFFSEIYVDEYQDTNEIQEQIINLISGNEIGKHNLFTVGDVKQSIYGFRQAKPELFTDRYYRYQEEKEENQLIELQNNFRSRRHVLDAANYLCYRLMKKEISGIEYDEKVALFAAMDFPEDGMDDRTECMLLKHEKDENHMSAVELEAAMIGMRIREMVDAEHPQMVTEVKEDGTKGLRKAEYRDIVILLRTVSGWGEEMQEQLLNMGIPAFSERKKGSFTSMEVMTIMSMLKVLDNERQDIPFAAFLRAPFIGLSGEEMVWMMSTIERSEDQKPAMADYFYDYLEHGTDKILLEKLEKARTWIERFREEKVYRSISELIWDILMETEYYHMAGAMPDGEQRQANLRMLVQKAKTFESGSYRGLFHFIRYMEQLKEYDLDYGEANIQGEHENVVRIMSIHKSKGLEYPIVFVSGLSKQFNFMDTREAMLMHSDFYLGPNAINLDTRVKTPTLLKKVIADKKKEEILGEELRILYVAMTRAKDKMILTGAVSKLSDNLRKQMDQRKGSKKELSIYEILNAKSYMDWILPVYSGHVAMKSIHESYFPNQKMEYDGEEGELFIRIVSEDELLEEEIKDQAEIEAQRQKMYERLTSDDKTDRGEQISEEFDWVYEHIEECGKKIKYSVSEIKQRSQAVMAQLEEDDFAAGEPEEFEPMIPNFLQEKEVVTPASRGTAVHKCMELLDFSRDYTKEELEKEIKKWIAVGSLEPEMEAKIPISQILWFLKSRVGKRIKQAQLKQCVYKEQQFVVGVPLSEMEEACESEELAVVQGIVDLYFEEDGEMVLVDYKTDRIKRGEEEVLIKRYHSQMESYKRALEQMTNKKVKECYIVSLTLRKNLSVTFE